MRGGHEEGWEKAANDLRADLVRNHEGLGIHVERVATGTLPRFELKARRVKDERIVKGGGA